MTIAPALACDGASVKRLWVTHFEENPLLQDPRLWRLPFTLILALSTLWPLMGLGHFLATWNRLAAVSDIAFAPGSPEHRAYWHPGWWGLQLGVLLAARLWPAWETARGWLRVRPETTASPSQRVAACTLLWWIPLAVLDALHWSTLLAENLLLATRAPRGTGLEIHFAALPFAATDSPVWFWLDRLLFFSVGAANAVALSLAMLLLASRLALAWRRALPAFLVAGPGALAWRALWHGVVAPAWAVFTDAAPGGSPTDARLFAAHLVLVAEAAVLWPLTVALGRGLLRQARCLSHGGQKSLVTAG